MRADDDQVSVDLACDVRDQVGRCMHRAGDRGARSVETSLGEPSRLLPDLLDDRRLVSVDRISSRASDEALVDVDDGHARREGLGKLLHERERVVGELRAVRRPDD